MYTEIIHSGARRRKSSGVARMIHRWIARAAEHSRMRRDMAELSRRPRHLLRDMGLEDYAAPPEPHRPPYWL